MQIPYVTHRRVEFRDTDAAGIMHFSTFFTYMEEVEHEFLRALGTRVVTPLPATDVPATDTPAGAPVGGKMSWPRVAAECQYLGTARFEDELEITIHISQVGTASVTYGFRFRVGQREIATGSVTTVCCKILPDRPPESMPIPNSLRELLSNAEQHTQS